MSNNDLEGVRLTYVESYEELQQFFRWVGERRPIMGLDTETKGLDYWNHMGSFCRLVQFGDATQGWALSVNHWRGAIAEVLRTYDRPVVTQNGKYDLKSLKATDLPVPLDHQIHDTFLMDQLLNPLRRHGLKEIATTDIHPKSNIGSKFLKLSMKNRGWNWETIPEEALAYSIYSALDPVLTARLWEKWYPQLGDHQEAYDLEVAYSLVCADMEYRGLKVDKSYLGRLRERWESDIADIKDSLAVRGIQKPNSRLQVITSLEKEGWEPQSFTATGAPAVDKTVLEALKLDYETAQELLEYRAMTKRMANYINKMENHADKNDHIHPDIRVMGARTGRSSITNPPLQQLPKAYEVRRAIIPEEGHKIWAIDYAAEEFLLLIGVSQDPVALELIESGKDVHRWVAAQAYVKDYEDVTKESKERGRAKNTLYASLYMAQAAKVAATAGIDEAEAAMILEAINGGFNVMDTWRREFTAQCEAMDYPEVQVGDRRIPLPADRVFTTAVNTVIQGLGAQVLKRAVLRIKSAGLSHHLLIPVHDEGIFQLPDTEDAPEIAKELGVLMVDRSFRPNLTTEVTGPLASWGHAYKKQEIDFD